MTGRRRSVQINVPEKKSRKEKPYAESKAKQHPKLAAEKVGGRRLHSDHGVAH